jgi:hypothetical protein
MDGHPLSAPKRTNEAYYHLLYLTYKRKEVTIFICGSFTVDF